MVGAVELHGGERRAGGERERKTRGRRKRQRKEAKGRLSSLLDAATRPRVEGLEYAESSTDEAKVAPRSAGWGRGGRRERKHSRGERVLSKSEERGEKLKKLFLWEEGKREKKLHCNSLSLSSSSSSSYCSSLVFLLPILPTPKETTPLLRARAPPARKKLLATRSKGVSMRRKAGRGRRDFFLILLRDLSGGGSGGGGEEEEEEEEEEEKRRSRRNKEQTSSAVASQPLSASNGSPTPTRADLDPVGGVFRAPRSLGARGRPRRRRRRRSKKLFLF